MMEAEARAKEEVLAYVGGLMGEAVAKGTDRNLARMLFHFQHGMLGRGKSKTYTRSRRLWGVTAEGEKVRYDDETQRWVPR